MKANSRRKFLLIALGLVLLAAFWMPPAGKAQGVIYGNSVPDGQVVDQNLILNGTEVSIDGTVNGDVLAIGRTITLNGEVNGTLLAVGESIIINGQVPGNVLAGAVMMELGSEGEVGRELYFAGARLTLPDGSTIQRDLYLLSLEAQLSGDIGRDIHAIIGPLQIAELILGPLENRIKIIGAAQPEAVAQAPPETGGFHSITFPNINRHQRWNLSAPPQSYMEWLYQGSPLLHTGNLSACRPPYGPVLIEASGGNIFRPRYNLL